tara:strand:- start:822 stop:1253 length:432 start_codon:yes stop_codon:yes gene_type:complete
MSKKPESVLHQRLKENLPNVVITRLENRVGLGLPDCLIAIPSAGFAMVELKVVSRGRKVRLSPHQVAFNLKHGMMGMPAWILVQYHPKGTTKRTEIELRLYHGSQVVDLVDKGIDVPAVLRWPLPGIDWDRLRKQLTEPYNNS